MPLSDATNCVRVMSYFGMTELMGHELHMALSVDMRDGLTSSNVWGTLPGTTDENIIVLAHQDGYYEASLDNASGQSVMMTLLDYF